MKEEIAIRVAKLLKDKSDYIYSLSKLINPQEKIALGSQYPGYSFYEIDIPDGLRLLLVNVAKDGLEREIENIDKEIENISCN